MPSSSFTFWLLAAAMIVVALAFVLPRLFGRDPARRGPARDELNAAVYRTAIDDLDRERDAGALAPAEAELARAELARRLLEEAEPDGAVVPVRVRGTGVAVAVALPVLALALYAWVGSPAAVEAPALVPAADASVGGDFRARLLAHLADAPRDGRAWIALARLDMDDDRFDASAAHYAKAIDASPKIARDPGVLCEYADALGMAQGGRLDGKPAELIARALVLDPSHPKALEMAGSEAHGRRDFRAAARHWRRLLEQFPPGTPEYADLAAAVERAERQAALTLPPERAAARGS